MSFLLHSLYILIYLILIVLSCELFTNAIEHLGDKLKLGKSATGSILTVFGTTLPETTIPLVILFSTYILKENVNTGQSVALGGIFGSPFMLLSLALFFLGIVLVFKKRKNIELDYSILKRDYQYFIFAYVLAFSSFYINKYLIALLLVLLYFIYVYRTVIKSKECYFCEDLDELIFKKMFRRNNLFIILFQVILSVLFLVILSRLFMKEIIFLSSAIKISPFILSMIITPFATELPECTNSILWVKNKKDDLAMANILGATIFQSTILMTIGILLTPWKLNNDILLNIILTLCASLFIYFNILFKKQISYKTLLLCFILYLGYFIVLFLS